jgi:hypothetical protein
MADSWKVSEYVGALGLVAGLLAVGHLLPAAAQAPASGLAGEIIQARQKNDALVRQYSWECRRDVLQDGVSKDLRIEAVNYGPGGQLQRTLVNDQSAPLPFGFFAARIAEEARAQVQQALVGLRGLLDQYTLPSSGKIAGFISQATISAPDANGVLQLTGGSVVVPGDTLSLWVDARTRQPRRMRIMTYYQGYEVTATATFNTLASGLNYMAYAQVNAPATGITLQVQNFDYINQNF